MQSVKQQTGISDKDFHVLRAIVNNNPDSSLCLMLSIAKRVIKNIELSHALALGYLIGLSDGTEKVCQDYSKSFQLCQRQN